MDTMNNPSSRRAWLIGLALGVPLALLLSPTTRWLVRDQVKITLGRKPLLRWDSRAAQAVAERHPQDYQIQYALAANASNAEALRRLRALEARFPDTPSLYANVLRYATLGQIRLNRADDFRLEEAPLPRTFRPATPRPEDLAAFDADAAAGERLDPDNAFFPLMRAIGLFAARRDADALAAVRRAGTKTTWREYYEDDVEGRRRLRDEAFDDRSMISHVSVFAALLFPHYAPLRGVARNATYQAVLAEQGGRPEDGLAIRRALTRCGGLMRAQSRIAIGSLVGVAITQTAMERPGGAPADHDMARGFSGIGPRAADRLRAYQDYVRRLGHPEESRWIGAESEAGLRVQAIIAPLESAPENSISVRPIRDLFFWWFGCIAVLLSALWVLLLGGATSWAARRLGPEPAPLPADVRWALMAGAIDVAMLSAVAIASPYSFPLFVPWAGEQSDPFSVGVLLHLAAGPTAVALGTLLSRRQRPHVRRGLVTFLLALVVPLAALALIGRQAHGPQCLIALGNEMFVLSGSPDRLGGQSVLPVPLVCLGVALAVPLPALLVLAARSRARRVPLAAGVLQGFRTAFVPIACALALLYGGLALGTLRQERRVAAGLARVIRDEGPYLAEQRGQPWPGLTPGP